MRLAYWLVLRSEAHHQVDSQWFKSEQAMVKHGLSKLLLGIHHSMDDVEVVVLFTSITVNSPLVLN